MSTCPDCEMDHDPFDGEGCPEFLETTKDAYASCAGEMYYPNERGYIPPEEVLEMLEPDMVAKAKQYALRYSKPWPPSPVNDLGMVQIIPLN
jgi:hypothetical protein